MALAPANAQKVTDGALKFASSTAWRFWLHDCLDLAQKRGQMFDALMLQPLLLAAQAWYQAAQTKLDSVCAELTEKLEELSAKPNPAGEILLNENSEIINEIRNTKKLPFDNLNQVIKINQSLSSLIAKEIERIEVLKAFEEVEKKKKIAFNNLELAIRNFKTKYPKQTSTTIDLNENSTSKNTVRTDLKAVFSYENYLKYVLAIFIGIKITWSILNGTSFTDIYKLIFAWLIFIVSVSIVIYIIIKDLNKKVYINGAEFSVNNVKYDWKSNAASTFHDLYTVKNSIKIDDMHELVLAHIAYKNTTESYKNKNSE